MFKITADSRSLFQLDVSGERLRQLLALRIQRLTGAIERETKLVADLRLVEEAQRAHDERVQQLHAERARRPVPIGIGAQTAAEFGDVMVGPYRHLEAPSQRHEKNVRTLGNALAEIRWLHDEIHPKDRYQLSRGDLAVFGDFDIPGSGLHAMSGESPLA